MHICITAASDGLDFPVCAVDKKNFQKSIRRLHTLFKICVDTCPVPIPSPGLRITPEIRSQCELYLPLSEITPIFNRLYSAALTYQPILSSTPFYNAMSWADVYVSLAPEFQVSGDPGQLLEELLSDVNLLTRFLFASFLPNRFYGGMKRYPGQQKFIEDWLGTRKGETLSCLDAACGTGEGAYSLALLLLERGFLPGQLRIDGWTLEPLEVWTATYRRFPHNRNYETVLKKNVESLVQRGFCGRIKFSCRDVLKPVEQPALKSDCGVGYDLIICNGLLGGPIVHEKKQLEVAVSNLTGLLAAKGILLAADSFHGGWKQECPQSELRALFEKNRLKTFEAGEGVGGLKSDQ